MLEKPDLKNPGYYINIPPAMFLTSATNPPPVVPPTNQVFQYNDGWFQPLTFSDTSLNLLGVGWLERFGKTNLYDTKAQTLITYSQAHDTIFTPAMGKVVLGGYAFQIPPTAAPGQTYQIQIGRPSATSDGIGAPGLRCLYRHAHQWLPDQRRHQLHQDCHRRPAQIRRRGLRSLPLVQRR